MISVNVDFGTKRVLLACPEEMLGTQARNLKVGDQRIVCQDDHSVRECIVVDTDVEEAEAAVDNPEDLLVPFH